MNPNSPNSSNSSTNPTSSNKITKYRPYLSLEEITILITLGESLPTQSHTLTTALHSLNKTKLLAENGIKTASYTTNPRKSLTDKLGFSAFSSEDSTTEAPDFDTMMESLTKQINPTE